MSRLSASATSSRSFPSDSRYAGGIAGIATMHGKETVVGPVFEQQLGLMLEVVQFDTDTFGTFAGDVPRTLSPKDAAIRKAQIAADASNGLGVGSEGSFGRHPSLAWVATDHELLAFVDREIDLTMVASITSTEVVAASITANSKESVLEKIASGAFGDISQHALILRSETGRLVKGLRSTRDVAAAFDELSVNGEPVVVESDLRAHCNRARQVVIGEAAQQLAQMLSSCCPHCDRPGFWITQDEPGLACRHCAMPTPYPKSHQYSCAGCHYQELRPFDLQSPDFCAWCNP